MATTNLERNVQDIFAKNAPSDDIAAIGSFAAGQAVYTDNLSIIQSAAYLIGWSSAVYGGNNAPFLEEMNAIFYLITYQLAYILQKGIPEYSAGETYFINDMCQSQGVIYISVANNNIGQPLTNATYWQKYSLPAATTTELGTVKIGDNVSISDGFLSADVATSDINNLQTQIDAINASTDVRDVVGTYAELQNYDTSTLGNNDIVKVLSDSTQDNKTSYYRWVITNNVGAWVLIGSEGPYVTVAAANQTYAQKTDYATTNTYGLVKIGSGINNNNGIISVSAASAIVQQEATTQTGGTITLNDSITIYPVAPSSSTTLTFDVSGLTLSSGDVVTFEMLVDLTAGVQSVTFPASVEWVNDDAPDLSTAAQYLLVFRSFDLGTSWIGNLQGSWGAS